MAGLLDDFGSFIKTPEGQGLLSAAFGGLATARADQPFNTLGRAGLAGLSGYGNAIDRNTQQEQAAQQKKMQDLHAQQMQYQLDASKRQQEKEQGQAEWRSGLTGAMNAKVYGAGDEGPTMRPDTEGLSNYLMNPNSPFADDLLRAKFFPKAPETKVVGDSLVRVGPDGATPIYTAKKDTPEDPITKLIRAAGIDPTSPEGKQIYAEKLRKETTHAPAPSATVVNKQEGEEAKKVGGFFGEAYADIQKAGFNANAKIARGDRLSALLDGVDTGKFTPVGVEVAKAAKALGLNIDDKLPNKEAAQALSGEMALELRNPSGGAGMPGAMSDSDRNFLAKMVPGLEATPDGRKLIIDTSKKLAQRDQVVAKMARAYRTKNGSLNEGFYDELATYSAANPLFADKPQGGSARAAADAILNGSR